MPLRIVGLAAVPLPKNVFRVRRKSGKQQFYWQERRGRPDHGPLVRLPDDMHAPEFWAEIRRLERGDAGQATAGSFAALIDYYETNSPRFKALSPSSKETYGYALDVIRKAWGDQQVRDLKPSNIYVLLDQYADKPSMGNLVLAVLRTLIKEGIRHGYADANVAREIEGLDEAANSAAPWSEETYAYVIANAPPILARAAVLARATGQRGVDLVRMRPVDRRKNGIDLTIQKIGDEKHWVPIHAAYLPTIDGWGVPKMVPYLAGERGQRITARHLRDTWKRFRTEQAGTVPGDATLHDLRAMAVCDRRLKGVAHQQIADQIGMSLQMVMAYSRYIDREANAQAGMALFEQGR